MSDALRETVRSCGNRIAAQTTRPHRHPALSYKAFWIDIGKTVNADG